jgi:hypothetical protein
MSSFAPQDAAIISSTFGHIVVKIQKTSRVKEKLYPLPAISNSDEVGRSFKGERAIGLNSLNALTNLFLNFSAFQFPLRVKENRMDNDHITTIMVHKPSQKTRGIIQILNVSHPLSPSVRRYDVD